MLEQISSKRSINLVRFSTGREYLAGHDFDQFASLLRSADPSTIFDPPSTTGNLINDIGVTLQLDTNNSSTPLDGSDDEKQENDKLGAGLISKFEMICKERAESWFNPDQSTRIFDSDSNSSFNKQIWILEANSWSLIRNLLSYRYINGALNSSKTGSMDLDETITNNKLPLLASDKLRIDLIKRKRVLQELLIVKEWLEQTAPSFVPCKVKKGYFRKTVEYIRNNNARKFDSLQDSAFLKIVSEGDPDSKARESTSFHVEDEEYNNDLDKTAFNYLRRGNFGAARDLFDRADQPWKSASISGGILWQDTFYDELALKESNNKSQTKDQHVSLELKPSTTDADKNVLEDNINITSDDFDGFSGNRNRNLWKHVCEQIAANSSSGLYERALYSVLSGSATHVFPVCNTWEDALWTLYNLLIENYIDNELSSNNDLYNSDADALFITTSNKTIADSIHSPKDAFMYIESSDDLLKDIKHSCNDSFHIFIKYFILDDIDGLLSLIHVKLSLMQKQNIHTPFSSPNFIRFIAHFIIVSLEFGFQLNEEDSQFILKWYVKFLIDGKKDDIVSLYTSFLRPNSQIEIYAEFLIGLPQSQSTNEFLISAYKYNLDVSSIVKRIVSISLDKGVLAKPFPVELPTKFSITALDDPTTIEERNQIYSVGWLLDFRLVSSHRSSEAVFGDLAIFNEQAVPAENGDMADLYLGQTLLLINLLCRNFLLQGRVNCIWELFNFLKTKFQSDNFEEKFTKRQDWIDSENDFGLGIVELFGYKYILTCLETWREWNVCSKIYSKLLSRVSGGRIQVLKANQDAVDNFTNATEKCSKSFEQILTCDWLLSVPTMQDSDSEFTDLRSRELDQIRFLYLPKLAVCYLQLLIETSDWNNASSKNIKRILKWLINNEDENLESRDTARTDEELALYNDNIGLGLTQESIQYSLNIWHDWNWVQNKYHEYCGVY